MERSLLSNPPYNLKWTIPDLASFQPRFQSYTLPPAANANYAFILSGLFKVNGKAVFIMPNSVLNSDGKEKEIRRELIEDNLLEAVISLPERMFESTNIPTCILVFNKDKKTQKVAMVDLREQGTPEERLQNGQFGGASHEGRTYKKTINTISEKTREMVVEAIKNGQEIKDICRIVSPADIKAQDYCIQPSRYFEIETESKHRPFEDIIADYNRIVEAKNSIKITMNKTAAKTLGFYEAFSEKGPDLSEAFAAVGAQPVKENFITFTASDGIKIEVSTKGKALPHMIMAFLQMWKLNLMNLNDEENRILAEFRDALLPELMSGKIKI